MQSFCLILGFISNELIHLVPDTNCEESVHQR